MVAQHSPPVLQVSDAIDATIADVIASLPTILAALVILVVGYVVGRILGGIVTRIVRGIDLDSYSRDTGPESTDRGDGVARALGKVVAFYVYFVALLAAADVLDIPQLTELLAELGAYLPVVLGALVVLVVGFVVGRVVGDVVAGVVGDFGIGPHLRETPLERFGDREGEFGHIVGLLVTYYIYLLTLLAVADILAIDALSSFLDGFAAYIPALAGGLLVLLVGIWVAERVGDLVAGTDENRSTTLVGLGVKVLIYYVTITVALAAIGFETAVLTSLFTAFVVAFLGALALALALGIGIAVGLGGQDYVAENIDDWVSSARETVEEDDDTRLD